jgi:hypothetical protein
MAYSILAEVVGKVWKKKIYLEHVEFRCILFFEYEHLVASYLKQNVCEDIIKIFENPTIRKFKKQKKIPTQCKGPRSTTRWIKVVESTKEVESKDGKMSLHQKKISKGT